jgi:demethylmenaquinone methyltransferase/2-methoxy-6-polyprenyl-1,4-benzoquinol methylase
MNSDVKQKMRNYYDERAPEYDEIYFGQGPAIPKPKAYKTDTAKIRKIVSKFGTGHLLDMGCGTGYWLAYYAQNCKQITLVEQSKKMLTECKKRIDKRGLKCKCHFIHGDFFETQFESNLFDSAFAGFFVSHLYPEEEKLFFIKLKRILKPNGYFMLIDSAWSEKRKQFRQKEGLQKRILNDGSVFTIYKRYFDSLDIESIFAKYSFELISSYIAKVFFAVQGLNRK